MRQPIEIIIPARGVRDGCVLDMTRSGAVCVLSRFSDRGPMNFVARLAVKLALWAIAHPGTIKELVDAIHAAKQKPVPATP